MINSSKMPQWNGCQMMKSWKSPTVRPGGMPVEWVSDDEIMRKCLLLGLCDANGMGVR